MKATSVYNADNTYGENTIKLGYIIALSCLCRLSSFLFSQSHPSLIFSFTLYTPKSTAQFSRGLLIVSRAKMTSTFYFSPSISEDLGEVTIFTAAGDAVQFQDLWNQNEGITVVALLRHLGCPCSWELASTLKKSKEKFDSADVKLVVGGVGTPGKAPVLGKRAYDILGLYYGWGRTFFSPASIAKMLSRFSALRSAVKNYTITATPDDRSGVLQQGGMFVFKGKQLLYARKDEVTSDHAPLDDVWDVC